jgi:hypothetical protein
MLDLLPQDGQEQVAQPERQERNEQMQFKLAPLLIAGRCGPFGRGRASAPLRGQPLREPGSHTLGSFAASRAATGSEIGRTRRGQAPVAGGAGGGTRKGKRLASQRWTGKGRRRGKGEKRVDGAIEDLPFFGSLAPRQQTGHTGKPRTMLLGTLRCGRAGGLEGTIAPSPISGLAWCGVSGAAGGFSHQLRQTLFDCVFGGCTLQEKNTEQV